MNKRSRVPFNAKWFHLRSFGFQSCHMLICLKHFLSEGDARGGVGGQQLLK